MVNHSVTETYENDSHFDLTYIIFVWITFLPTVTLPWFLARWVLIGSLSRVLLVELFWSGSPRLMAEVERRQRQEEQDRIWGNNIYQQRRGNRERRSNRGPQRPSTVFSMADNQLGTSRTFGEPLHTGNFQVMGILHNTYVDVTKLALKLKFDAV